MDYLSDHVQPASSEQALAQWSEHILPHSHHGTPAQEPMGFTWTQTPTSLADVSLVQSQSQSQSQLPLQSLLIPQWPSMLTSQAVNQNLSFDQRPPGIGHVVSMPHVPTFATENIVPSIAKLGQPSGRRTLSDADRRNMCIFSDQHPQLKQTDIGSKLDTSRSCPVTC